MTPPRSHGTSGLVTEVHIHDIALKEQVASSCREHRGRAGPGSRALTGKLRYMGHSKVPTGAASTLAPPRSVPEAPRQ